MKLKFAKTTSFVLVISCLAGCQFRKNEPVASEPSTKGSDSVVTLRPIVRSRDVQIVPSMNSAFADQNTVHCANIEYLWNTMMTKSDKSIPGGDIVNALMTSNTWARTMDTSKLVLAFGAPDDIYQSIIKQYKKKYNINKKDLAKQGDSFWAYTDKIVDFKYARPFSHQRLLFLGTEVSGFGFESRLGSSKKESLKDQFRVLYYDDHGRFVVKLIPSNSSDEIILSMVNKRGTFLEMFNTSKSMIKKGKQRSMNDKDIFKLKPEDELIIPVMRFDVRRTYDELDGLKFSSQFGSITDVEQSIKFDFDREGVMMGSLISVADSILKPQKPKSLLFDRPFYLYIKEANAPFPYFNLWVSDMSIMEKAGPGQ